MGKEATKDQNMQYNSQKLQAIVKWLILHHTMIFKRKLFAVCWSKWIQIEKQAENVRVKITLNKFDRSTLV